MGFPLDKTPQKSISKHILVTKRTGLISSNLNVLWVDISSFGICSYFVVTDKIIISLCNRRKEGTLRYFFVTINSMCAQSHSVLTVLTLLIVDPICLRSFVECYSTQEGKGLLEPSVTAWNGDSCDILVQLVSQMHDQW